MDKISSILMIAMCLAGIVMIIDNIVECIEIYLEHVRDDDWVDDDEEES